MTAHQTSLDLFIPLAQGDLTDMLPPGFQATDDVDAKIAALKSVITRYLADGYALFVAWSAGKDSSVMLALTLLAMREYVETHGADNCPEMVVIYGDTLLENPVLASYAHNEIRKIRAYAQCHGLPVQVEVARPNLSSNYLVNLIGGRSIASVAGTDRTCATMMKVKPVGQVKARVLKRLSRAYDGKVLTLVGKRYDESAVRKADMIANGEVPHQYVMRNGDKLLSAIAHFTLDDIYWVIGMVRSELMETYSDFTDLVEVYRGANGGECMVNAMEGKAGSAGCGARFGCWICLQVNDDTSMQAMLSQPQYRFMAPLIAFRNYIQASHNDPAKRTWLARSINEEEGTIQITPNAYSPAYSEELLLMALSMQADEEARAEALGIEPRFTLLAYEEVLAIDVLWARYGYHRPLEASAIWQRVYEAGVRACPPAASDLPVYPRLNSVADVWVPFCDDQYDFLVYGLRDVDLMAADHEAVVTKKGQLYSDVLVDEEFVINTDELETFALYELSYALKKFNNDYCAPSAALHYLLRMGLVALAKGQHARYDGMVRMSNQIWRSGLRPYLNSPAQLIEVMGGDVSLINRQACIDL